MSVKDLERLKAMVRVAWPNAQQLATATLAAWMEESKPSLFVVDVRSTEEFAVSHLRDAVNLQAVEQVQDAMTRRGAATTVLYCSVGFRSSRLAQARAGRFEVGLGRRGISCRGTPRSP
jgi:rhodanese-related sulfurtransferase